LLLALGAAQKEAGRFYSRRKLPAPAADQAVPDETFDFRCDRARRRVVRRREGRYRSRRNLTGRPPAGLGAFHRQLVPVAEAFKNRKGGWRGRPGHHQKRDRSEAHRRVAFLAGTLHVCLRRRPRAVAGGRTPRAGREKFCAGQRVDVPRPTTDGREGILTRHTQPEQARQVRLPQRNLTRPAQPPPKITPAARAG
jgi:hypothetical protein